MTYSELIRLPLVEVQSYLCSHPDSIAAQNAVRQLEHNAKIKRTLSRIGRASARVDGMTVSPHPAGGGSRRCPTKRELQ